LRLLALALHFSFSAPPNHYWILLKMCQSGWTLRTNQHQTLQTKGTGAPASI
jgi:hypothetical protein